MKRIQKSLGVALAALFTLLTCFSYAPVQAASKSKAKIIPQVQFVSAPVTEYKVGDRVSFDISTPNYGKKVEYRVILWEDSKKISHDLWNAENGYPDCYYTKWQPWGNNVFTLGWPILEPGNYRITVYTKRVGIKNDKTFLKGNNCDSYKESVAFTVKPNLSTLDKEGQTYGSNDINKPVVAKNDVNITAKNVTLSNASIEGNINITGDNAIIKNVTATGNIIINPGKDGSATLENVTAKKIEVQSGGKESIHIKNVKSESLVVNSTSPVRVETDGDTEIVSTTANGYVIFDKKAGTFGTITITKTAQGETVIEFRGDIQDKVVVETQATIKTTEGSKLSNLVVATENPQDKVVLQGTFANVEVSKPAMVEIAAGTTVTAVEVNANAEVKVATGATVLALDTNNNTVKVDNQGTITKQEGTGVITPNNGGGGGGGGYYPPSVPEVTYENANLNTAINAIIGDMNGYSLSQSVFGPIGTLSASGINNTIALSFKESYKDMSFETIVGAAKDRVIAHKKLNDSQTREVNTFIHMDNLLTNVTVNSMRFKDLFASKLVNIGKTRTANFFNDMNITNYNVLYDELNDHSALYTYDSITAVLHALIPGQDVTINSANVYGLTVQTIKVGNNVIYNSTDKTIELSEIRTGLGLPSSDADVRTSTPELLTGKSIIITLKDTKGTIYTYNINF